MSQKEPSPAQAHLTKTIKGLVYVRNEMANQRYFMVPAMVRQMVKLLDAIIKDLRELEELI